jgi:murein DD-endopeptidase MepM/ murein hydrolase activator NlpD
VKRSPIIALGLAGAAVALAVGSGMTRSSASAPRADIALAGELTQGGWARGTAPAGTATLMLDGKPVAVALDGGFFLAFDRDAGTQARLVAQLADGGTVTRMLTVSPRAWKLEYIPLGPKPGTPPSEAFRIRRAAELAQINAARAIDSRSQGWRQRFVWPVHGRLSGMFGSQRIYNGTPGSYHSGTDIAGATGTPIAAPADGVVILAAASPFTLEGNLLMLDHGMGLNSAFLHCSQILVRPGEAVKQGQIIARIGMTGRATGPHLHWSIKWRDSRLDPMLFTGPMQ